MGWIFEMTYSLLRIQNEPPMTRFLAKELSTSHWFDISNARKDFGYEPKVSIKEGLVRLKTSLEKA
jgi:nucleoside-diphosphate-sugar epimerase